MCHVKLGQKGLEQLNSFVWGLSSIHEYMYNRQQVWITWPAEVMYTGMIRFTPRLGSWDFRRNMKRCKLNHNLMWTYVNTHGAAPTFSVMNTKYLEDVSFHEIYVLKIASCLNLHWKLFTTTPKGSFMSPISLVVCATFCYWRKGSVAFLRIRKALIHLWSLPSLQLLVELLILLTSRRAL